MRTPVAGDSRARPVSPEGQVPQGGRGVQSGQRTGQGGQPRAPTQTQDTSQRIGFIPTEGHSVAESGSGGLGARPPDPEGSLSPSHARHGQPAAPAQRGHRCLPRPWVGTGSPTRTPRRNCTHVLSAPASEHSPGAPGGDQRPRTSTRPVNQPAGHSSYRNVTHNLQFLGKEGALVDWTPLNPNTGFSPLTAPPRNHRQGANTGRVPAALGPPSTS